MISNLGESLVKPSQFKLTKKSLVDREIEGIVLMDQIE